MTTPDIPSERDERAEALVAFAAHTLTHIAKLLARIGILVPVEGTETQGVENADTDTIIESMELALTLLDDHVTDPATGSAIFVMSLRWLTAMDMIAAYRAIGEDWRDASVLDCLHQVEALCLIVDQRLNAQFN